MLPVQASSVACERLFSAGKHITTDTRARLNPDVFEQLQVLKMAWRQDIVDIARENEMFEEEVQADESAFAVLEALDNEDLEWREDEDSIM